MMLKVGHCDESRHVQFHSKVLSLVITSCSSMSMTGRSLQCFHLGNTKICYRMILPTLETTVQAPNANHGVAALKQPGTTE